jgi:hypothetical protein
MHNHKTQEEAMRFEAEQFELNLQEENYRLKQENKILREQFVNVARAIHEGDNLLCKVVSDATAEIDKLNACQAGNGLA